MLEDKAGMVTIKLTDKAAIREKIIPILDGFPLRGEKNIEYQVFKQAMDIEESKLDRRVIDSKLEELKTREKKPQNQVTPEISKDRGVSAKTEIDKMSEAKLQEVFDP